MTVVPNLSAHNAQPSITSCLDVVYAIMLASVSNQHGRSQEYPNQECLADEGHDNDHFLSVLEWESSVPM